MHIKLCLLKGELVSTPLDKDGTHNRSNGTVRYIRPPIFFSTIELQFPFFLSYQILILSHSIFYRFKAQSVYNHHLLTHSDARNYKCPYCPKTFKTSVQLSGHKNSHTKPFTCTECNRPFGSLYAVRAHMESHKRPNHNLKHICDICGAKYARRFALNDHMKEQHKDVQLVQIVDVSTNSVDFLFFMEIHSFCFNFYYHFFSMEFFFTNFKQLFTN